jgi:tol-pal system protein YbgF
VSRLQGPRTLALAVLAPLLVSIGCVSSDDIEGLHRQMNDIERQIQAVETKSSSKEEVQKLNASVAQQTNQLLKSNADTGVKLDELSRQIEALQAKLDDTNRRLAELSQQIAATQGDLSRLGTGAAATAPSVGAPRTNTTRPVPPAGSAGAGPSPQQLYDTAYGDYTKGRYELSIAGFQDYIDRYPSTDLSDNAQYWIGESHFSERKFDDAIKDFDALLKRWPQSDKAAAALLKKGLALRAQPPARAVVAYIRDPRVSRLRRGPPGQAAADQPGRRRPLTPKGSFAPDGQHQIRRETHPHDRQEDGAQSQREDETAARHQEAPDDPVGRLPPRDRGGNRSRRRQRGDPQEHRRALQVAAREGDRPERRPLTPTERPVRSVFPPSRPLVSCSRESPALRSGRPARGRRPPRGVFRSRGALQPALPDVRDQLSEERRSRARYGSLK